MAALGLAAIGGAAGLLFASRPGIVDGAEQLATTFDLGALPFDLRIANAARLPTGELTVILEPPDLKAEAPPPPPVPESKSKPGAEEEPPVKRFDWSKIALGEKGSPPRQVVLAWFPEATAEIELKSLFREVDWKDLRDLGESGGLVAVGSGKLDWGGYDAPYIHLRSYERGGAFRDSIRVNLSAAGQRCAVHILWSRGVQGSKERVVELLAALAPRVKPAARRA
jgi:hypothetical protein